LWGGINQLQTAATTSMTVATTTNSNSARS
jgi:hypothetical protein